MENSDNDFTICCVWECQSKSMNWFSVANWPACVQSHVTETLHDERLAAPAGRRACWQFSVLHWADAQNQYIWVKRQCGWHTDCAHVIGFVNEIFQAVENASAGGRYTSMDTALVNWFSWSRTENFVSKTVRCVWLSYKIHLPVTQAWALISW